MKYIRLLLEMSIIITILVVLVGISLFLEKEDIIGFGGYIILKFLFYFGVGITAKAITEKIKL